MNENKLAEPRRELPVIALIVADSLLTWLGFLDRNGLPRSQELFPLVLMDMHHAEGRDPKTPVIILPHRCTDRFSQLERNLRHRFQSVREMDY